MMSPTRCPHPQRTTRSGAFGRRPWSKCGPSFGCSYPSESCSVRVEQSCSATETREIVELFQTRLWKRMFPWNMPSHRRHTTLFPRTVVHLWSIGRMCVNGGRRAHRLTDRASRPVGSSSRMVCATSLPLLPVKPNGHRANRCLVRDDVQQAGSRSLRHTRCAARARCDGQHHEPRLRRIGGRGVVAAVLLGEGTGSLGFAWSGGD